MPILYGDRGTVRVTRLQPTAAMFRARFTFETDADGYACSSIPFTIQGTLISYSSSCPIQDPPITGNYSVRLHDEWGVDQFDGLVTSLDADGASDGPLYLDLDGSDRRRPLLVCNPARILFDRSATPPKAIVGVFDLYWTARVQCPAPVPIM